MSTSSATDGPPSDVLVLGASFAGIEVVRRLARDAPELTVHVVDRQTSHGYIPLVQERLCHRLPLDETALPTGKYVEAMGNITFIHDTVTGFRPADHEVVLASGRRLRSRFVVIALGSELRPPAGIVGREHILTHKFGDAFDEGHRQLDRSLREREAPHLVVAGGGISGVELAAEFAFLSTCRPPHWHAPRVVLLQAHDRLLPDFDPALAAKVHRILENLGVSVRTSTRLARVEPGQVAAETRGSPILVAADLVFWTGGVAAPPILGQLGLSTDDQGWLRVSPTLQLARPSEGGWFGIFACGDAVRIESQGTQWATMQRAIECLWQAKVVAHNIIRLARAPNPRAPIDLVAHRFRSTFPYGISLGPRSLIVAGNVVLDRPRLNTWFRRFLMRRYFARYRRASE